MTEQSLLSRMAKAKTLRMAVILAMVGLVIIPSLYAVDYISIETVNLLGRYMTYAILAVGLDLLWGYVGILGLCQATFFCLGTYTMGMYLAHHGGPEGIVDANGWKLPACLFVVYPYDYGEAPGDATVPWFWKPFWNLSLTIVLGLLIPAAAAFALGYFVFRSRVRGVYFAILTQAIAVAAWMVFCRNDMMLGGTNGLTRFDHFIFGNKEHIEVSVVSNKDLKTVAEGLEELQKKQSQIRHPSDLQAIKMLEQELVANWDQLTESVGHLSSEVAAGLKKVDGKVDACVEAFDAEGNATQVGEVLDELSLALDEASTAVTEALEIRPLRFKQVQLALERRREEKRATMTMEVDRNLYLLGNSRSDGNESSPVPKDMELKVPFGGQDPDRSYVLAIEQRGVDEEWRVALNDQHIGNLKRGPPKVIRLSVPDGALKESENNLTIRPAIANSRDEIEVGRIRLLSGEVPPLGGTLEQKGDNFLSVPEFGVNVNSDYNELVIHADPGDADKNVKLQDWANVKYLGPNLSDDSVKLILYLLTVLALLGAYFLCRWIVESRLGRVLMAIRDDEGTLRFFGYRPYVYKLFAFCVAASLAGLGGMLYAPQMKITTPADMEAYKSILIVVWVAVGGRGTLSGAILGALSVNLLYNYLTSDHDFILFTWKSDYWQFILGGLFVTVVLFLPRGLMSLPEKYGLSRKFSNLWSKIKHGRQR